MFFKYKSFELEISEIEQKAGFKSHSEWYFRTTLINNRLFSRHIKDVDGSRADDMKSLISRVIKDWWKFADQEVLDEFKIKWGDKTFILKKISALKAKNLLINLQSAQKIAVLQGLDPELGKESMMDNDSFLKNYLFDQNVFQEVFKFLP